jgi:hypothetical protein
MRNMRSALWALGLAGAAYAWKNRDRLREQLNSLNGQRLAPQQLPDYSPRENYSTPQTNENVERPRETRFGGTEV